jgi:hypothetical protein
VKLVDRLTLTIRALGKAVEFESVQALVGEPLEGLPELGLAGDPEVEHLQLDHSAEWRVPGQLAVELEPAQLLGEPGAARLEATMANPKAYSDSLQRLAVGFDFRTDPRQRLGELGLVAIAGPQAAGQLDPQLRSSQMVIEVDRQQAVGWSGRRDDR